MEAAFSPPNMDCMCLCKQQIIGHLEKVESNIYKLVDNSVQGIPTASLKPTTDALDQKMITAHLFQL